MSTEDAVKLIREYANAAINHYCAVNEVTRRTPEAAASQEEKAARKLFKALTGFEPSTATLNTIIE